MKAIWKLLLLLILVSACQPGNAPGSLGRTATAPGRPSPGGSGVAPVSAPTSVVVRRESALRARRHARTTAGE